MFVTQPAFRPLRFCRSGYLQTLGGFFLPGKASDYQAKQQLINLQDGDRLVIHDDRPEGWCDGDRIAIVVPGLCGSHGSSHVRRTAEKLQRLGIRTIRVDMRGLGASALISRSHSHAGSSGDIQDVVEHVCSLSPNSRISLIGFSLGGNVVLKLLGEWGNAHPGNVDSAVAVSPPIDLVHASTNLRRGSNRIFEYFFMHHLRQSLVHRRRHVKGLVDPGLSPLPTRLIHFDDQFVAPVLGLRGAREYYEKCSSGPLLTSIQLPTFILAAVDDPIVPHQMYERYPTGAAVKLISTKQGGHLGFLGHHPGDPDRYWLDWRLSNWISSLD